MRLWTRREISEITNFSLWKIDRAIKKGTLASRKIEGSRRITHQALVAWLGEDPLEPGARILIESSVKDGGRIRSKKIQITRDDPTLFDL